MIIPQESRRASRVILMDERDRVLFCRGEEPVTGRSFWVMPGGGVDAGETFAQAAVREVFEETGLTVAIGPCVWYRRHRHEWNGGAFDQFEQFFPARVSGEADLSGGTPDSYVKEYRWWTLADIAASGDTFAPRRVAELLPAILQGTFPEDPFDCGV